MTVTNTAYILNIDRSGATPTVDEEFTVTFDFNGSDELVVWTIDSDGVLTRKDAGADYIVFDTKIRWVGLAPSDDIRIQRYQEYSQPNQFDVTQPNSLEMGMDEVCLKLQQQIKPDSLEPRHWSAEGDVISNITTPPVDTAGGIVTKKDVDTQVGGSSGFTIAASDVGKFAETDTGETSGWKWDTFNGTPDPKGKERKYLTGDGWTELGVIPTPSGNTNDLLKDVNGVPTWTDIDEFPSGSTFGQILSRTGSNAVWRNSAYMPTPLGNEVYTVVKQQDDAVRNEWKGRIFMTTEGVTLTAGFGGTNLFQHEVYRGSITNEFGVVPDFLYVLPTEISDAIDLTTDVTSGPVIDYTLFSNIRSISASTIELGFASPLHQRDGISGGSDIIVYQSPPSLVIEVTMLWYFKS